MKNLPRLALLIYGCLILERVLVEFPRATLTLDSVYYALGASRFSEGAFGETFSGPWQPLMAWLAGIQVFLGLDPLTAVVTLSVIGGGLAVVMFTRIAYVMGGWPAALITGAGLASDQRVLFESAAVRSDGLYLGIAAVIFGLLLKPYDRDQGRVELSFFGWCAVLGAILVALRVAALPVVGFIGLCLLFGYKISRKARTIGVVVFSAAVGLVLGVFCLFYYRRFGVFVPSLNFVLNKFLLIAEWSKTDPEAFCRLYDGKNTMLADRARTWWGRMSGRGWGSGSSHW
ncbi:MAG: hypothetical protein HYR96_08620 [Deltaproteobacteria bacterium]|nr:hypothetical protein [Deltaproteobacteria bacterium]